MTPYHRLILPTEPRRWRDTLWTAAAIASTIIAAVSFVGLFVMLWSATP